jgi:hypothetical protein
MIIVSESSQVAIQAGFAPYDHVIQALSPNGADHPLDVGSRRLGFVRNPVAVSLILQQLAGETPGFLLLSLVRCLSFVLLVCG